MSTQYLSECVKIAKSLFTPKQLTAFNEATKKIAIKNYIITIQGYPSGIYTFPVYWDLYSQGLPEDLTHLGDDLSIGLSHLLEYYRIIQVNIIETCGKKLWLIHLKLKDGLKDQGIQITSGMAYNFNRDLEYFIDGSFTNIGYQNFLENNQLFDNLTLTISFPDKEEG